MVEHLLIGLLAAILVCGAQMLNLNAVHIPDPLIHAVFEFLHRWEICRDGIRGPNVRCGNPVKGQPTGSEFEKFGELSPVPSLSLSLYLNSLCSWLPKPIQCGTLPFR